MAFHDLFSDIIKKVFKTSKTNTSSTRINSKVGGYMQWYGTPLLFYIMRNIPSQELSLKNVLKRGLDVENKIKNTPIQYIP